MRETSIGLEWGVPLGGVVFCSLLFVILSV